MSNSRRDRDRRPGRRSPFREPKPVILIVCEGEKTERQYFEGFRRAWKNSRVDIRLAKEHGVPKTLVEIAKALKNEAANAARRERDDNLRYDSVWCVFDVDEHPHVSDAREMARDNNIQVAVSNPCFELWLILHFRDNPGMQHRHKIQKLLERHVPEYDKAVDYKVYAEGYPQAVVRAKQMDKLAETAGASAEVPTTGVYKLTEIIRSE